MKPLSIARLSLIFVMLTSFLVAGLGAYFWFEFDRTAKEIQKREYQAASDEINEALRAVARNIRTSGDALGQWEETRQQLYFPDYYALWRDDRVHDAGMIPSTVKAVALYDKLGHILNNASGPEPMPLILPGGVPGAFYRREQERDWILYFVPIHADPTHSVLLGYLGMKFNLMMALRQKQTFRYADPDRIQFVIAEERGGNMSRIDLDKLAPYIRFEPIANPDLKGSRQLFQTALARLSVLVLGTLFAATWLLNQLVIRPLRRLSTQIDMLRNPGGELDETLSENLPLPILELDNVRRSFNEYHARLSELHDNLEQSSRSFYDQARRDALTGAYNRRAFEEDWEKNSGDRRVGRTALLLFDCDHFKAINDTYGHNLGDAVIKGIAESLQAALRVDDRLYRIGGDEFATILWDTDIAIAEAVAERCLEHILSHDFRGYGMSEPVTISIGLALSVGEDVSLGEMQKHADLAMYTAKRPGSAKVVCYRQEMGGISALVANREITAVFQAIQNPELIKPCYQAVMRLPSISKDYVEALTRIRDGDQLIRPDAIFPIVQARNLDAEFDLAVIRAIERDLAAGCLPVELGVSINLSAPGIVNAKVVEAMLKLVRAQGTRKIIVEITETALITQMDNASENILKLKAAGALVALDDFGSGYSSLRYLASMPVNLVKFDISMIHLLMSGETRQKRMIEEIAGMVISAGYEMVAEGVETRELLDKVIELGFSHAQGYYFGKPGEESMYE
jgi:diguanylate cyclase (GGDEF)-like protein